MKAMVLKAPKTPLVLETVPDPVPGAGEAVARVLACGAGLTITHARAGRQSLPNRVSSATRLPPRSSRWVKA